jgi:hypothetical protein
MTRHTSNIREAEERCIDLLMEGVMKLDSILYDGAAGLTFHDLWRVYRYADAEKLEQLLGLGLPVGEAVAKSLVGSKEWDEVLTRKVEAMSDDEAEELAERIRVLDEVRRVLQEEILVL